MSTGDDAYSFALRTAYLNYLLQPRPRRQVPAPVPAQNMNRMSTINVQDLVADFSRGLTQRDATKSIRLPKDFLPLLRKRIESVVVGRDPQVEYRDVAVKRTFGSFYSAFVEPRYYETTSKSRRPEDLLLIFYTHATKELQTLRPEDWKALVDRHVALFVRLMSIIIREHGWASSNPELTTRLATLEKKLLRHDENLAEDAGTNSRRQSTATVLGPPDPLSYDVSDMPMVKTVARVFNVPLSACQDDINKNKGVWTEKAAFQDMKLYMNNLSSGAGGTLRSDDFDLDEAYEAWKKAEKAEVSEFILLLGRTHQELLQSPLTATASHSRMSTYGVPVSHRASIHDAPPSSSFGSLSLDSNGSGVEDQELYAYIPNDARGCYRHVTSRCLTADLNDPDTEFEPIDIPGSDEPVRLMSKASMDLVSQCALRWRLPKHSRMVLFLDALRTKYQEGEVGLPMLEHGFMYFDKELLDSHWTTWTIPDQNLYNQMLSTIHDFILRELYDILQHSYDKKAIPIGPVMWVLDRYIYNNEQFTQPNMDGYYEQLKEGLKTRATEVLQEIVYEEITVKRETERLDPLHVINLTQRVTKLGERIQKRFKEPIMGYGRHQPETPKVGC